MSIQPEVINKNKKPFTGHVILFFVNAISIEKQKYVGRWFEPGPHAISNLNFVEIIYVHIKYIYIYYSIYVCICVPTIWKYLLSTNLSAVCYRWDYEQQRAKALFFSCGDYWPRHTNCREVPVYILFPFIIVTYFFIAMRRMLAME